MTNYTLDPEDYIEPRCLLCEEPYGAEKSVRSVPQMRIIDKMNEYMARRDYEGAERHLLYWLEEAQLGRDLRGQLMLRNELTGHYRKTGEKDKSLENAEIAIALLDELEFQGTISSGTTYVNAATAYNAFGEQERSMELFEKARAVYESSERTNKDLLGGLYNNMALTCVSLGRYEEALPLYESAIKVMADVPDRRLISMRAWIKHMNSLRTPMLLSRVITRSCWRSVRQHFPTTDTSVLRVNSKNVRSRFTVNRNSFIYVS